MALGVSSWWKLAEDSIPEDLSALKAGVWLLSLTSLQGSFPAFLGDPYPWQTPPFQLWQLCMCSREWWWVLGGE